MAQRTRLLPKRRKTKPYSKETMPLEKPMFVLDDSVSLKEYVALRRKLGYGRTSWKRLYSSRTEAYWGTNFLERWIYMRKKNHYEWEAGVRTRRGRFVRLGYDRKKSIALKLVRILQDYLPTTDFGLMEDKYEKLNTRVEGHKQLYCPQVGSKPVFIPDAEIRRVYGQVCAAVRRRYKVPRCPALRIVRGKCEFHGRFTIFDDGTTIIQVADLMPRRRLRLTVLHEFAHFLDYHAHQTRERSHGIHFLEFYKALAGRDYFEHQQEVAKELEEAAKQANSDP